MLVGTTALRAQLPHVRVLAEGLRTFAPEAELGVLLVDGTAEDAASLPANARLVDPPALMAPEEWARARAVFPAARLLGALTPLLLEHLLTQDAHALFLDAGTLVLGSLDAVRAEVEAHPVTLAARAGWPSATEPELGHRGPFSPGCVGAGRDGVGFLRWWAQQMGHGHDGAAILVAAIGTFAPRVLPRAVAPVTAFGLSGQSLTWDQERLTVNGVRPPAVVLGTGFTADHPTGVPEAIGWNLLPSKDPGYRGLVRAYADRLRAAGGDLPPPAYGWDSTPSGLGLDDTMRRLYAQALAEAAQRGTAAPPGPFAPDGGAAFAAWLVEPSDHRRNAIELSRYLVGLREDRPDLAARFPDVAGSDGRRLLRWAQGEPDIPVELIASGQQAAGKPASEELLDGVTLVGPPGALTDATEAALRAAGIAHATIRWSPELGARLATTADEARVAVYDTNLLLLEPRELQDLIYDLGVLFGEHRRTLAFWQLAPGEDTGPALTHLDAVLAATPALAEALTAYTEKPVLHVPAPAALRPGPPRRTPAGPLALGVVADLRRPIGAQFDAVSAAVSVAADCGAALTVALLGADHDRGAAEIVHANITSGVRELKDERQAAAALYHCDAVLATHAPPETPPGFREAVALGLPVLAPDGAHDPSLLAGLLPPAPGGVAAQAGAVRALLADRAALAAAGAAAARRQVTIAAPEQVAPALRAALLPVAAADLAG